jgi:molecular chaperone GrpE
LPDTPKRADAPELVVTEEEKPREAENEAAAQDPAPVADSAANTGGDRLAQLEQALQEKEEAARTAREQMLRTQADFENFRRRQQNSLDEMRVTARENIVSNLLPLLDNLERALDASQSSGNVQALVDGVKLILRQMNDILTREGLSPIDSDGVIFDPALHEAVMTEDRDDVADQTIVQTLQKGYKLGHRVLRPSLVKVAHNNSAQ